MSRSICVQQLDDRVVATLNRPEVRNAIDREMSAELNDLCSMLERDPKVLLLGGEGGDFAAGADLNEMRDRGRMDALEGINSSVFVRLQKLPMPTIALVDGYALGGGAELAYAFDFRVGTSRVTIGNPEPRLGIVAAAGGTWRLRELVGDQKARRMLLTGQLLDAASAYSAGLLDEVVEPGDLLAAGHRWADRIGELVPLSVRLTKSLFDLPKASHPFVDDLAQAVLFETEEKHERMTAFLERKTR